MTIATQKGITKAVGKVGDLPAMPEVVAEVLRLTEDPDVALADISAVIERDPGLTAKLLRVSNSPYYGMRKVVGTLKLALVILGVREVRNIVLGISVMESLRTAETEAFALKSDFWNHSVNVAAMCKKLGDHFDLSLQGEDFVAGLLHDIGKLILWHQIRQDYEPIFTNSGGATLRLCEAERATFGFDHSDAAALLAEKWNMPGSLSDAIWCHHSGEGRFLHETTDPKLTALVRIADLASRDDWDNEEAELKSCLDEEAWDILSGDGGPVDVVERRAILQDYWTEIQESPALVL